MQHYKKIIVAIIFISSSINFLHANDEEPSLFMQVIYAIFGNGSPSPDYCSALVPSSATTPT